MEETVKAYTAGIIDGEGSISLSVHTTRKTKSGRPATSPKLLIQVSSTDEELIRWLMETWMVGHVTVSHRPKRPNHKVAYGWRIWGESAATLLETVMPYMRIKRPQAELGVKYYREKIGPTGKKVGDEEMLLRMDIQQEMFRLNGRIRAKNAGQ